MAMRKSLIKRRSMRDRGEVERESEDRPITTAAVVTPPRNPHSPVGFEPRSLQYSTFWSALVQDLANGSRKRVVWVGGYMTHSPVVRRRCWTGHEVCFSVWVCGWVYVYIYALQFCSGSLLLSVERGRRSGVRADSQCEACNSMRDETVEHFL